MIENYDVEEAMEILLKAEEIKQDDKLMSRVLERIKSRKKSIESIDDLRNLAQDKSAQDDGSDDESSDE